MHPILSWYVAEERNAELRRLAQQARRHHRARVSRPPRGTLFDTLRAEPYAPDHRQGAGKGVGEGGRQMSEGAGLRAADGDRERAASVLRDSFAQGRIDMEEFSERLDAVYAARTTEQLWDLLGDLPTPPAAPDRAPDVRQEGSRDAGLPAALTTYLAVMALLVTVWAVGGAGYFWPVWPMLGWGVCLLSRAGRYHPGRSLPGLCGGAPGRVP